MLNNGLKRSVRFVQFRETETGEYAYGILLDDGDSKMITEDYTIPETVYDYVECSVPLSVAVKLVKHATTYVQEGVDNAMGTAFPLVDEFNQIFDFRAESSVTSKTSVMTVDTEHRDVSNKRGSTGVLNQKLKTEVRHSMLDPNIDYHRAIEAGSIQHTMTVDKGAIPYEYSKDLIKKHQATNPTKNMELDEHCE